MAQHANRRNAVRLGKHLRTTQQVTKTTDVSVGTLKRDGLRLFVTVNVNEVGFSSAVLENELKLSSSLYFNIWKARCVVFL